MKEVPVSAGFDRQSTFHPRTPAWVAWWLKNVPNAPTNLGDKVFCRDARWDAEGVTIEIHGDPQQMPTDETPWEKWRFTNEEIARRQGGTKL